MPLSLPAPGAVTAGSRPRLRREGWSTELLSLWCSISLALDRLGSGADAVLGQDGVQGEAKCTNAVGRGGPVRERTAGLGAHQTRRLPRLWR